jgi:hypothetical protein
MRGAIIICLLVVLAVPVAYGKTTPYQVGGFTLGKDISSCQDRVNMETVLPIRYQTYLKEVEINIAPGFKSGLIQYGTCAKPGQVVRIKLKYKDKKKKFYQQLLKQFKKRFGEPDEWRGDPFHVVIGWKWSFTDGANKVSLILQHNTMDAEEKLGNVVKLTLTSAIKAEHDCYKAKQKAAVKTPLPRQKPTPLDWDQLIPR